VLRDFPGATASQDLQSLARAARVHGLLNFDSRRWPDEMSKWACEALKAAQIFYSLKQGLNAPRDKRIAFRRFIDVVPSFEKKSFASSVWDVYWRGEWWPATSEITRDDYRATCREFIAGIAAEMEKES
jgi:hypothetical protein